jgi:hypothetical protein
VGSCHCDPLSPWASRRSPLRLTLRVDHHCLRLYLPMLVDTWSYWQRSLPRRKRHESGHDSPYPAPHDFDDSIYLHERGFGVRFVMPVTLRSHRNGLPSRMLDVTIRGRLILLRGLSELLSPLRRVSRPQIIYVSIPSVSLKTGNIFILLCDKPEHTGRRTIVCGLERIRWVSVGTCSAFFSIEASHRE